MANSYFYTDPLAAAWMAKHFGMKFDSKVPGLEPSSITYSFRENDIHSDRTVYLVHPDSVKLLEPQVGDVVKQMRIVKYDPASQQTVRVPYGEHYDYYKLEQIPKFWDNVPQIFQQLEIIQRNNITFICPEKENG